MATENQNVHELVADDDPTAELEALTIRHAFGPKDPDLESDANTFDIEMLDGEVHDGVSVANLKSDLKTRSETIERLQFDIEQLHAKWLGLETEIKAREEVTSNLNAELKSAARKLERKETLLEKRDLTIRTLKSEIRDRESEVRELQQLADRYLAEKTELEAGDEITVAREQVARLEGELSRQTAELAELDAQQRRTESYADQLRRQLSDINEQIDAAQAEQLRATEAAASAESKLREFEQEHSVAIERAESLAEQLRQAEEAHAAEVQTLRSELGEAEEAIATHRKAAEDLTTDLRDTRGSKDELEKALAEREKELRALQEGLEKAEQTIFESQQKNDALAADLDKARASRDELEQKVSSHDEELRTLRFELGEAEQTIADNQKVNDELASDLVHTRGFKEELEKNLAMREEESSRRIEELEKQVDKLNASVSDYEEKLGKKSDAINCLLAELAKKSQEIDSIGEMEDVIQEIDVRMSERIDDRSPPPADRVTRLLVGKIDEQELRFPLFKDRLTIGRTQQNDIQLDAPYISRRHAVVATEGEATRVIDWGSKNGVYVNSRRVTEHFLKNGDIVTIGNAKFRYEERPKRDA